MDEKTFDEYAEHLALVDRNRGNGPLNAETYRVNEKVAAESVRFDVSKLNGDNSLTVLLLSKALPVEVIYRTEKTWFPRI